MERRFTVILSAIAAVLLAGGLAAAAPTRLTSLVDDRIKHPARVAVDAAGNVFVSQSTSNALYVYDRKGQFLKSLSIAAPLGIAFDSSGKIYVCSDGKKSVEVYNADFTHFHSLGTGQGEFGRPNSAAIDSAGAVYVTDSLQNTVKVYDGSGKLSFTIGTTGSGDGQFIKPLGIAINDAAGEVYVNDQPVIQTSSGPANGARIQVFGKDGAFKRSFGTYGDGAGQIARPMDLGLDRAGNLYVVDSYLNVVHVFDPATGTKTASLSDTAKPLSVPTGMGISRNQAAYVASYNGSSVDVYALDGYTTMEVTPASLTFQATQYQADPAAQTIVIANSGSGTLSWTATTDQPWIKLAQTAGTTGPGTSGGLSVSVTTAALTAGAYSGTVTLSSDFGQVDKVTVNLTVLPPPILSLSNGWLTFSAKKKTNPLSQTVGVETSNVTTLAWSVFSDSSWLSVSPAGGTAAALTTISVTSAALPVGTYTGYLTFSAPGAIGDGSKITVNLTVSASTKITVTANTADAKFTLSGPSSYAGAGASWAVEDAPAGDYTISYDPVAGYRKPASQTKALAETGDLAFTGTYASFKDLAARRAILAAAGPGSKNTSQVKAYKNDGSAALLDFLALETKYGASVASGDVDGDGTAEIIVGAGPGPENTALVRVYKTDMTKLAEFTPFAGMYGVNVAAADFDGDGAAEIIVAHAGGSQNPGAVKAYSYNAATRAMVKTGIDITAHASLYGATVAAADIDGDGLPELVTAAGPGPKNAANAKVWTVVTAKGMGNWTLKLAKEITREGKYGATVAGGDIDGDGKDEIIIGAGPDPKAAGEVAILRADGTELKKIRAFDSAYGVNVAAADLDGDGIAEIIAGAGPDPESGKKDAGEADKGDGSKGATLRVMSASGEELFALTPFANAGYGVRVAVGELGL
jgi:sugar lactone lactonase YvrE